MTTDTHSTHGIEPRRGSEAWRSAVELLSSMRFAIALLTVICIASVIGTVIKQHEPGVNYVNQFGPFWAELFLALKLNAVYSAWWFLLILAFLVTSTSLCIARNTPKFLADIRSYKENIRHQSLQAFHHKAQGTLAAAPADEARRIGQMLAGGGWKVRLQERDTPGGKGWMVAAKAGAANKIGYIAAHSAIVLICLGGLFDGDLFVRALTWFGGKSVYAGGGLVSDVKPEHRLPQSNPAFRGNLVVAEGTAASTAILSQSDGILLQELPFSVELKKFIVEYYSTGMPKLFASDIVIHDKATGKATPGRVEVNHPVSYGGVQIYQSSFDDGGSSVKLRAVPMNGGMQPFTVEGTIGGRSEITNGSDKMTLEYTALRVINVENLGDDRPGAGSGADVRKVDLGHALTQRLGAADKTVTQRHLRNVGPSITYKLRDPAGQAREYHNYMLPVDTGDGSPAFLLGVRASPAENFRYLRIPADDDGSIDGFVHLRAALLDPAQRERAVRRYVAKAVDANRPELADSLAASAARALALFAGAEPVAGKKAVGGLQAISDFMESAVPEAERERAADVLLRILNGSLLELNGLAREGQGRKPLPENESTQRFMTQAVLALSDAPLYPAPVAFELQDFKQVQASVFQVARAPGQNVVYLGCLLLILGVFAMLYIRERRLWVWLAPQGDGAHATMALSSNRKTLDADREFEQLQRKLLTSS
ncbi:cytochrome c biogenesis protein ResB [Ottowia sp.]|uniref:cytochrome c biogenesis protein ResB n=1 Tax=Ottowia sp. TaxID=1898956 RepID=UPI002CB23046|nr:cytochrome c biogenesis protein ResB [Ottowia sp.]HOB65376.1 cytochrome c biogenesis protein ResB [Ottowia sp.]HPZ58282.1 cytochrome c biogenesis protein ResB [Ottowia sp.]HQD46539.1 cytochrome c biogenesis protein ResB [Ottowia sp.]